jgi:hypothetical protein
MATRTYLIASYRPTFDAALGRLSRLVLFDPQGNARCDFAIVADAQRAYEPRIAPGLETAAAILPCTSVPALLDLLRHEERLQLTLDDAPPGDVTIHT